MIWVLALDATLARLVARLFFIGGGRLLAGERASIYGPFRKVSALLEISVAAPVQGVQPFLQICFLDSPGCAEVRERVHFRAAFYRIHYCG